MGIVVAMHMTWLDWSYVGFYRMRQFSICLAQLGGNIIGGGAESVFGLTCATHCQIWGMGGGGVGWCGDAQVGRELATFPYRRDDG